MASFFWPTLYIRRQPVDDYINYGLRMCDVAKYSIYIVHEFCAILLPCLVLEKKLPLVHYWL